MKNLEKFMEEYEGLQKELAEIRWGWCLRQGKEWALKDTVDDFHYDFYCPRGIDEDGDLAVIIPDGGGHFTTWSVSVELIKQSPEERKTWLKESFDLCKKMVEEEKAKYEDRRLNSTIGLIKHIIATEEEGYKEHARELLEELLA